MARKKPKPDEELAKLRADVDDTIRHWLDIRDNGCNDPGWPDGVNLNLVRNHLSYYKQQIKDLCQEHGCDVPEEAYTPDLPFVDNNYFADPKSKRAKAIMGRPGWRCANLEDPSTSMEYDDFCLCLF